MDTPVLDKERRPTSVRNARAVPKPSAAHLETEDKEGLAGNGMLRRCDLPILVQNICPCLALTLNPAEPSAQASLNFVLDRARLSLSIHNNLLSHPPTHPPQVSSPSTSSPTASGRFSHIFSRTLYRSQSITFPTL